MNPLSRTKGISVETNPVNSFPAGFHISPKDSDEAIKIYLKTPNIPIIDKNTPITSMGSCFADNIRIHLKNNNYNYLMLEPDCGGFTANWGRVYNTGSMRQIVNYSNNLIFTPIERWWKNKNGSIVDPYRAVKEFENTASAQVDFEEHMQYSRQAIEKSEVIILTVGLTETWRSRQDGFYFFGRPINPDPNLHEFHIMFYEEIISDLGYIYQTIKAINPGIKLIFTVSPVPLKATFRSDICATSASSFSKAVILSAVHTFCLMRSDTHYFPSFEIVRDVLSAKTDKRGVYSADVLECVMNIFHAFYIHD